MNNKQYRKMKAYEQIDYVLNNFKDDIEYSILNSKIYDANFKLTNHIANKDIKFELISVGSDEALLHTDILDKIGLLNFASYKNPGGGFINGSIAQEESLCHQSTLYNVISTFKDFYDYNAKHTNYSLYLNRAIYSPNIIFNNGKIANVITCAAPNNHNNNKNNSKALASRIEFVLDIAEDNDIDVLVLGAYGCGVFNQDPNEVAKLFIEGCQKRNFKKVIFAIPDIGTNFYAFENALKEV